MKYLISNKIDRENHAGNKARNDIEIICLNNGYEKLPLLSEKFSKRSIYIKRGRRILEPLEQYIEITRRLKKIDNNSKIIIQYPLQYIDKDAAIKALYKTKHKKNLELVAIIHDINTLRGYVEITQEKEAKRLSIFDIAIVHNETMKNILVEKYNFLGKILILEFFDYLSNYIIPNNSEISNTVIFAGNLTKSLFCQKLKNVQGINFNLYGICNTPNDFISSNVKYCGQYTPEEIVKQIEGSFGLVWDGDSIETCSGGMGNYLKYNTSHKISLYLVAHKPLIVWSQSATATYVLKYNIGITIDSLEELPQKLQSITPTNYNIMIKNVEKLALDISSGNRLGKLLSL